MRKHNNSNPDPTLIRSGIDHETELQLISYFSFFLLDYSTQFIFWFNHLIFYLVILTTVGTDDSNHHNQYKTYEKFAHHRFWSIDRVHSVFGIRLRILSFLFTDMCCYLIVFFLFLAFFFSIWNQTRMWDLFLYLKCTICHEDSNFILSWRVPIVTSMRSITSLHMWSYYLVLI